MNRWENKVAIVTGASAGIGATLAEKLVKHGVKVVGLARRRERLEALTKKLQASKGKFYGIVCDVTQEEDILKAFKWIEDNLEPVHILINNAGIGRLATLIEGDTRLWQEVFDTNVLGLCMTTKEALKVMKNNNVQGHIIHINSISGHNVPKSSRDGVYSPTKHSVTALTETLRQELNLIQCKIKISSVSPGAVDTEIIKAAGYITNEKDQELLAKVPFLRATDIADAVIYILSTPSHVQVHDIIIKPVGEIW